MHVITAQKNVTNKISDSPSRICYIPYQKHSLCGVLTFYTNTRHYGKGFLVREQLSTNHVANSAFKHINGNGIGFTDNFTHETQQPGDNSALIEILVGIRRHI